MYTKKMNMPERPAICQEPYVEDKCEPTIQTIGRSYLINGKVTCSNPSPNLEKEVQIPQSQVLAQLELLEKTISEGRELIENLEKKCAPILVPDTNEEDKCVSRPCLVPVADALYTLNERQTATNNRLKSILSRIEV